MNAALPIARGGDIPGARGAGRGDRAQAAGGSGAGGGRCNGMEPGGMPP